MVVFMCIPLMANGMEHFFGYLFVICISSSLVAQMVTREARSSCARRGGAHHCSLVQRGDKGLVHF